MILKRNRIPLDVAMIASWVVLQSPPAAVSGRRAGDSQESRSLPSRTDARVSPRISYVAVGESCPISFVVDTPGDSIGCIESWAAFDTAFVEIVMAEEGSLFKSAPYPRLFFTPAIAPDTQSVEGCLLGVGTYARTPGEIARYVFRAKREGTCGVRIARLNLFDIRRNEYSPVVDPNGWIVIGFATGIEPEDVEESVLSSYPNPSNPGVTLMFRPSGKPVCQGWSDVSIRVYTSEGRVVRCLFSGRLGPAGGTFVWDGRDAEGSEAASGVYFAVAETGDLKFATKIVLVR
jgi:hypothetical protein